MKVGDLVTHKRTGVLGMILRCPATIADAAELYVGPWDVWFSVQWYDASENNHSTRHARGELLEIKK